MQHGRGKRTDRVGHLIQMELSNLILHRIKDPRLGFVTVTHVEVSPDIKSARVFFSVMGKSEEKEASQKALQQAAGFLQREIGATLNLRYTPRLRFLLDDSIDQGYAIDHVLKEIEGKQKEMPRDRADED